MKDVLSRTRILMHAVPADASVRWARPATCCILEGVSHSSSRCRALLDDERSGERRVQRHVHEHSRVPMLQYLEGNDIRFLNSRYHPGLFP